MMELRVIWPPLIFRVRRLRATRNAVKRLSPRNPTENNSTYCRSLHVLVRYSRYFALKTERFMFNMAVQSIVTPTEVSFQRIKSDWSLCTSEVQLCPKIMRRLQE